MQAPLPSQPVTSFLPYVTGSAGAIVVLAIGCYLFFSGKLHSDAEFGKLQAENEHLKAALEAERRALDETARTGTVTNQLIAALIQVSTQNEGEHDRRTDRTRRHGRGAAGENVGP